MICDWCGNGIIDYADHFSRPESKPCRIAARYGSGLNAPKVTNLDKPGDTGTKIRARALRELARTNRRDRLERDGVSTHARYDRQGRT